MNWKNEIGAIAKSQKVFKASRKTGSRPDLELVRASNRMAHSVRCGRAKATAYINAYHVSRGNEELMHNVTEEHCWNGYRVFFDEAMAGLARKVTRADG